MKYVSIQQNIRYFQYARFHTLALYLHFGLLWSADISSMNRHVRTQDETGIGLGAIVFIMCDGVC